MRIDYSPPKQSYVTGQQNSRPRKEPIGLITTIAIVTGVITFIGGFGTGWFFSQRSAKKSFQAATEQTSLENSPKAVTPAAHPTPPPLQQPAAPPPQQEQPPSPTQPVTQGATEPALSFYKTLPAGQKSTALGSGINTKDDKTKQPLQAAIPSNLTRPADGAKLGTDRQPIDKSATKSHDTVGFSVQIGSYSLKSEAETLKTKFSNKGYNVTIVESNQGDKGTWYRVRIGKKLDQDAAKELAGKLGKSAIVVPDHE